VCLVCVWVAETIHPACMCDGGRRWGERGGRATTPTYTVRRDRRDSPAREPSWSAFGLQKPSILRACVREEDAGGREADAPLDLKMPLENGRADERVSRGQASERAVCVCETVSVEKGARRPPLPTAVVCPPGRRRRRRFAITAFCRPVYLFITAGPSTKLFALIVTSKKKWASGGYSHSDFKRNHGSGAPARTQCLSFP
jgi:hypothetical protein